MSSLKILLIGIFGLVAVMVITAAIHLVAPYIAVLVVVGIIIWYLLRKDNSEE